MPNQHLCSSVLYSWAGQLLSFSLSPLVQVDRTSIRHGGESVATVLKAHGVRFVFTLVGGHISPLLVACEKLGIRVIDTRHEVTAVFAADAVARLTGKGWGLAGQ